MSDDEVGKGGRFTNRALSNDPPLLGESCACRDEKEVPDADVVGEGDLTGEGDLNEPNFFTFLSTFRLSSIRSSFRHISSAIFCSDFACIL